MPKGIYQRSTTPAIPVAGSTVPILNDEAVAPIKLSAKTARAVEAVRGLFTPYVASFATINQLRGELAPKFMKAFEQWKAETDGNFVEFVRVLVPAVPLPSRTKDGIQGYRDHQAYQAADYLRRLVQQEARAATTPEEQADAIRNRPASPRQALARVIASIVPLIDPAAMAALWKAMESQLHWSETQVSGFRELVKLESPLVQVRPPRGLRVAHMLKVVPAAVIAKALEDEPRTGTHG